MSFFSSTWINGASMPQVVMRAGDIPPPLNERYFTQLDGQSKFFRRETPWACVDPVVEITFLGNTAPATYFLFDGVDATDRAFLYANANNGLLNTNAAIIELNSAIVSNAAVAAVVGELNKVIVTFSGSYRLQTLGARFSQDSLFAPTIIESIKLIDPADATNTFNYPMDKNLPYELPDGNAIGPELIQNGKPVDASVWGANNSTLSVTSDGYMEVLGVIPSSTNMNQSFFTELGKKYLVSFNNKKGTAPNNQVCRVGTAVSDGSVVNQSVIVGSNNLEFIGIGANTYISLGFGETAAGQTSLWRNISIREIPSSAFIFENGSIDGSDRLLVTEKQDGSGFVGETGTEYDYATGAAPPEPPSNDRYFTQLDGQGKYWRRIEPNYGQTTTATLECSFYGKNGTGFEYLLGRNSNDRFYIGLNSSGDVGYAKGGSNFSGQTTVDLTKINSAKLVADGTDVKFYVNSVLISTQAQGWSGLLDEVGFGVKGDQLLDFYSGILLSARVTTDTVDNRYGLDTNLPYDLPDGVELGPELWSNPASEIESGWVYNGNGSYTRSAAGNDSAIGNNIAFVSGQAVNITLTIDSIDVGGFKISAQGGASVNVPSTSGVHTVQCIAGASGTTKVSGTTASTSGSVSGVSIKVASALIFENGSVDGSDRLLVTKKEDGTGFVGETGIEYDYATGAAPVDSYSSEYSTAYS